MMNFKEFLLEKNFNNFYKKKIFKEFLRVEIFILLGVTFFTYFNQTSIETILIPFTEIMFGWTEFENSILFCLGGIVIILSYILIRLLSNKLADRWIMLMGVSHHLHRAHHCLLLFALCPAAQLRQCASLFASGERGSPRPRSLFAKSTHFFSMMRMIWDRTKHR